MPKYFIELDLEVNDVFAEILIAELAEIGFNSFTEKPTGVLAYVDEDDFQDSHTKRLIETYAEKTPISYTISKIEKQNWNKEWESNFSPIYVDDTIEVRADFHESKGLPIEILITPKMSFGTGHHETTHQVMSFQLGLDHKNKKVLDVGTGTGILAVLAAKLGATKIHAFDIEEWSVENTIENIERNKTSFITVNQGTIKDQEPKKYDIVLANINRNILLDEIPAYVNFMNPESYIIVSGFYTHDAPDIVNFAAKYNLTKIEEKSKNNWTAIVFRLGI